MDTNKSNRGGSFLGFLLIIIMLLASGSLSYTKGPVRHEFQYNGLVWVALDYYSIHKYKSLDIPKRWFKYKRIQLESDT